MALLNRVRVVWTGVPGSPAYTNLYAIGGSLSRATFQAAVGNFMNGIRSNINTGVTITTEGDVALIDSVTGDIQGVESFANLTSVGSGTGSAFPPANQLLVRWLTSTYLGGRQIRGRMYIPYLTTGAATGSGVSATALANVNGAVNTYLSATSGQAVVYSPKNGVGVQITSGSCWNQFAVMRSRRD